jgi:hypothetical protein
VFKFPDPVRWIAATLVHELVHINGTPAEWAAEVTLPPCGLNHMFYPAIVGMIVRRPVRI